MKKVRLGRGSASLIAMMSLILAGCSFSARELDEHVLNDVSDSLGYSEISRMAYMGGSVFYNPKAPSEGQLYEGTKVAVRLGKISEVKVELEEDELSYSAYCNVPEQQEFGYITIGSIDPDKISFTYSSVDENGFVSNKTVTIANGEEADLNGDSFADVKYAAPEEKRPGFEKAVYLTFISSRENLYTSMFSVIPEQYSRGVYPSGIMGINPDGKFIASKYEGESEARSAVKGLVQGDFVLDSKAGSYVRVNEVSNFKHARAIEDEDLEGGDEIPLEYVLPLLYVDVRQDADESLLEDASRAATYSEYDIERDSIEYEFSRYLSFDLLCGKGKVEHVGEAYAKIGIFGTFSITFNNVECNIGAATCVKFEVNPGYDERKEGSFFKEPLRILDWNKTITIGVVPFSVGVDGQVDLKYEKRVCVDWDLCVGFIAMYGATVKFGANYGFNWFKPYVFPYGSATPINRFTYYCGTKSGGGWNPTKTTDISIIPEIEITPKVGIAKNTLWVGLGLYDAIKLRKYTVVDLLTLNKQTDTYIYNKLGMKIKGGYNLVGLSNTLNLYNLTPGNDFVEIQHWKDY